MTKWKDCYGMPSTGVPAGKSCGDPAARLESVLRILQVVAFALGLGLVGWYLVARSHGHLAGNAAIDTFRTTRNAAHDARPLDGSSPDLTISGPVDTSLWSDGRLAAYQ